MKEYEIEPMYNYRHNRHFSPIMFLVSCWLVRVGGLEPPRDCSPQILSLMRTTNFATPAYFLFIFFYKYGLSGEARTLGL